MKGIISLLVSALATVSTAVPATTSIVLPLLPRRACNADNILRALRNTKNTQSASGFCSGYLQPTSTERITRTVPSTTPQTVTATGFTTTTATVFIPTATSIVCGANVVRVREENRLLTFGGGNPGDEFYLSRSQCVTYCDYYNCASFQSYYGYCALFNAPAQQVVIQYAPPDQTDPLLIYDRGCFASQPPHRKRELAARDGNCPASASSIPPYLYPESSVPPSRYSSACSCFLTASPSPACTTTSTVTVTSGAVPTVVSTASITITTTGTISVTTVTGTTTTITTPAPPPSSTPV